MHRVLRLVLSFAAAGSLSAPAVAAAQRAADLRPAGAHPAAPTFRGNARGRLPVVPERVAADSGRVPTPARRRLLWPWFTLGGAALGAGTVVGLATAGCDQGCRDDGGWGYVPYYAGAAALAGAVAGGLIGAVVDLARRHPPPAATP